MNTLYICTDGSALANNTGYDSASAYVVYDNDKVLNKSSKYHKGKTNNYAEMFAIFNATKWVMFNVNLEPYDRIVITTDSDLSRKSLTEWMTGWIKNGTDEILVNSQGVPTKNQEIIKSTFINICMLQMILSVHVCHVNSHCTESQIQKMYEKFLKQIDITLDEFKSIYTANDICDKLAKRELGIN